MNMHNSIPDDLSKITLSKEEISDFMNMLIKIPHQTVFEFVNTVWFFEGVSRAFQQQLTRTRQASYSIQSLRIVDAGSFAKEKRYYLPPSLEENEMAKDLYIDTMEFLESRYRELKDLGVKTEDARGILPLNIQSPITESINLRSLYHLVELRLCNNTQGEFKEIALQMVEEVKIKLGEELARPMKPICFSSQVCQSPVPCEKYGFKKSFENIDVSRWIRG
jgi:thymidylate synthase (FAD)